MARQPLSAPPFAGAAGETNVFRTLGATPPLAKAMARLGGHFLVDGLLEPRLRELVILRIAAVVGSDYEWGQHVVVATGLGVTADELSALLAGELAGFSAVEAATIRFADLVERGQVGDRDFEAITALLETPAHVLELVALTTYYGMVARLLVALDVDLDHGLKGIPSA